MVTAPSEQDLFGEIRDAAEKFRKGRSAVWRKTGCASCSWSSMTLGRNGRYLTNPCTVRFAAGATHPDRRQSDTSTRKSSPRTGGHQGGQRSGDIPVSPPGNHVSRGRKRRYTSEMWGGMRAVVTIAHRNVPIEDA